MKKISFILSVLLAVSGLIYSQSITVAKPNGGENWAIGSTHSINWTSSGITGNVGIKLFQNNKSIGYIAQNIPVNSGNYSWTISNVIGVGPISAGLNYQIQIKQSGVAGDVSNGYFTISSSNESIRIISPNGGENWVIGSSHEIKWSSSGLTGNIYLELLKNNNLLGPITDWNGISVSNNSYSWKVGRPLNNARLTEGGDYKISVISVENSRIYDTSDSNFSITAPFAGKIIVKKPEAGDQLFIGNSYFIKWESVNLLNPKSRIKIMLLKNDMSTEISSLDNTPPGIGIENTGSFHWHLKNDLEPGRCFIKVQTADDTVAGYSGSFVLLQGNEKVDLEILDFSIPEITYSNKISKISAKIQNKGANWFHNSKPNIKIRIIGIDKLRGGKFTFDEKTSFYNTEFYKGEIKYFDFPMNGITWPQNVCNITFAINVDPDKEIDESNRKNNFKEKTFFRDEITQGAKCGIKLYPNIVKIGKANLRPVSNNGQVVLPTEKVNIFMEFLNCCSKNNILDLNIIFTSNENGTGGDKKVVWSSNVKVNSGQRRSLIFSNIKIPKKNEFRWLLFFSNYYKNRYPQTLGVFYKFRVRVD